MAVMNINEFSILSLTTPWFRKFFNHHSCLFIEHLMCILKNIENLKCVLIYGAPIVCSEHLMCVMGESPKFKHLNTTLNI